MKVIKNDLGCFYDVDDTLVCWDVAKYPNITPISIGGYNVVPHLRHVEAIKMSKARGHLVVVWSQGGYEWAESVVKALGIEEFVDVVMSKPRWIYDDIPASEWMPKPFWFEPETKHEIQDGQVRAGVPDTEGEKP